MFQSSASNLFNSADTLQVSVLSNSNRIPTGGQ